MRLARQDRLAMTRREDRRHSRYPVLWSTKLTGETELDRYVLHGKIRNISISGVHVLAERDVVPGGEVTLRIDRVGTFYGRVMWSEDGRLGIAFDEASEQVVEMILDRLCDPQPALEY